MEKGYVFYTRNITCNENLLHIVLHLALITEKILNIHKIWHRLNNLYQQNSQSVFKLISSIITYVKIFFEL